MAGVNDFDFAGLGMEADEDGGEIAAAGLFALGPMVLVHARGEFVEGHPGDGHGAKGGTEAAGPDGGGEAFAGDVGYGDEKAAVGLRNEVEVVAANFVAGDGVEGEE